MFKESQGHHGYYIKTGLAANTALSVEALKDFTLYYDSEHGWNNLVRQSGVALRVVLAQNPTTLDYIKEQLLMEQEVKFVVNPEMKAALLAHPAISADIKAAIKDDPYPEILLKN